MAIAAAVLAQGAAAANTYGLDADYQFQGNRASSISNPAQPDLTDIGAGNAFATEAVGNCSGASVLTFPQHNGLELTDNQLLGPVIPGTYTVVMDVRLADVSGYRRLLDASNGTSDNGLYLHNGKLTWYSGGPVTEGTKTLANNEYAEIAVTRDYPGFVQGYVNGVDQNLNFDDSVQKAGVPSSGKLRLFKDNTSGGFTNEDSAGAVARVRIWTSILSPGAVSAVANESSPFAPSLCPGATATFTRTPRAFRSQGALLVDTGISAGCPGNGGDCSGTASVERAKKSKLPTLLGTSPFTVVAGGPRDVTVALSKKGRKALKKRKKLKVTTAASLSGPYGTHPGAQSAGKIRFPKKHH